MNTMSIEQPTPLEQQVRRLEKVTARKVVDIRDYKDLKAQKAVLSLGKTLGKLGIIMRDTNTGKPTT